MLYIYLLCGFIIGSHLFTIHFICRCYPQIWSDTFPNYDPYMFPQVWAVIPLKGVVPIPRHNNLRVIIKKINVPELLSLTCNGTL